jgi:hypothetical protein
MRARSRSISALRRSASARAAAARADAICAEALPTPAVVPLSAARALVRPPFDVASTIVTCAFAADAWACAVAARS